MPPRDDGAILEPEIEQVAVDHHGVSGVGHRFEKAMKCGGDRGWHLSEMRVGHDEHARCAGERLGRASGSRHGPKLGTPSEARKPVSYLTFRRALGILPTP